MENKLNLIMAPQEYDTANHIELWQKIGELSQYPTIVVNIGADLFVTTYKKKFYRMKDAIGGVKKISDKLYLVRPFYVLRPEISNRLINKVNSKLLLSELKKIIPDIEMYEINILFYGGSCIEILEMINIKKNYYYYLIDEVTRNAHNNSVSDRRTKNDIESCIKSNYIFLMSEKLFENRESYVSKMKVVGNGAIKKKLMKPNEQINNSVGIIGNVRDWIDCELLEGLIKVREDLHFGFVGNIEPNMQGFIDDLLMKYNNVKYYGKVTKESVHEWYMKFNVVLVPYKQNEFMKATRPIKIVESIFASTPVVTIPISGYEECSFIRFAKTVNEFSEEINNLIVNQIDETSREYIDFLYILDSREHLTSIE